MNKKINRIIDNHIWSYFFSRNLEFNRKKMIKSKKILPLEHAIWWLSNKRKIFYYNIGKKNIIYFWQEIKKFNNKKYFIGGWHSNLKKVNFLYILFILKWQFSYNLRKKQKYDWIAVVKKNNKWVLKLTYYLGYKLVKKGEVHYNAIKKIFKVSKKDYFFLKYIP